MVSDVPYVLSKICAALHCECLPWPADSLREHFPGLCCVQSLKRNTLTACRTWLGFTRQQDSFPTLDIACWEPLCWAGRGRAPTGEVALEVFLGSTCWYLSCAGRCTDNVRPSHVRGVQSKLCVWRGGVPAKQREEKLEN